MHRLFAFLRVSAQLHLRDPNNPHSTAAAGVKLGEWLGSGSVLG
jgi:hypothetical protein